MKGVAGCQQNLFGQQRGPVRGFGQFQDFHPEFHHCCGYIFSGFSSRMSPKTSDLGQTKAKNGISTLKIGAEGVGWVPVAVGQVRVSQKSHPAGNVNQSGIFGHSPWIFVCMMGRGTSTPQGHLQPPSVVDYGNPYPNIHQP